MHHRGLGLPAIASLIASNAADAAGLAPSTGRIAAGANADLVLWDLDTARTLDPPTDGRTMHRWSPYAGRTIRATPTRVLLRGRAVALGGDTIGMPSGVFVGTTGR